MQCRFISIQSSHKRRYLACTSTSRTQRKPPTSSVFRDEPCAFRTFRHQSNFTVVKVSVLTARFCVLRRTQNATQAYCNLAVFTNGSSSLYANPSMLFAEGVGLLLCSSRIFRLGLLSAAHAILHVPPIQRRRGATRARKKELFPSS